jgi:predicted phage terminase large subunit-like protein
MLSPSVISSLQSAPMLEAIRIWDALEKAGKKAGTQNLVVRHLCLNDLFYLLVRACKRADMLHPWIYDRCREVEAAPDNHLDLWAREHYKSTIVTFGKTMQKVLRDPNRVHGIFSHTRPIAKAFLRQIMREFEENQVLHAAFPDVLWGMDVKQSPKWSEDDGIIVRRTSNQKEATIEAWGLVDGQPTSKHFDELVYDDIVVAASVTTPEMIEKTMTALEQSYNLGTVEGVRRFAGTRWHFNDAYSTLIKRGTAKLRFHPGKAGGEESGDSVFWPESIHEAKRRDMGPYTYACQILLNPKADAAQNFQRHWVRHYNSVKWSGYTIYICVDAASSKKKGSDYTSMMVVGLGEDTNFYVLDMVRDRLNLAERTDRLFTLARKYKPYQIRYERYGMLGDIEHIRDHGEKTGYRIDSKIVEVAGKAGKSDRIRRMLPAFEQGRVYLPRSLHVTDWEKNVRDLVHDFIEEEYVAFPNGGHDDMMDCLARMFEPDVEMALNWPIEPQAGWNRRIVYPNLGIV